MPRIDGFDLVAPIGRGGVGVAWRAVHRRSGEEVAIKCLAAGSTWSAEAFRREARAVAAMDHPSIVPVYDYGNDAEVDGERVPYLVMELLGGTLWAALPTMGWRAVRRALVQVLDALAHAHARGVVHRDIKPGNVLRGGRFNRWKLVDFGLAHSTGDEERCATGTVLYMAPEQLTARWRDFGPQTDLWAVACVAWEAVTGRPPFPDDTPEAVRRSILQRDCVALVPRIAVPRGFESWALALLEKDPRARCDRAAVAAAALLALGEPDLEAFAAPDRASIAPPTSGEVLGSSASSLGALTFAWDGPLDAVLPASGAAPQRFAALPMPARWASAADEPHLRPSELGLGLFQLRRPPVAAREQERDALWGALRRVVTSHRPELVLLTGPLGSGTSRLAEWLCVRAHELGLATVLRCGHHRDGGPADGLRSMFHALWGTWDLDAEQISARLGRGFLRVGLDPSDLDELARWLAGRGGRPGDRIVAMLVEVLHAEGRERPLVIWVDDAAWGPDAVALCRAAQSASDGRPRAVFVLTGPDEASIEGLDRLKATVVHLGPMPPIERRALVRALLPLAPEAAVLVQERCQGWPLVAVQIVGDWVARGLLEVSPDGYRIRPDADDALPRETSALWRARVAPVVASLGPADQELALALAVLGTEVDRAEWEALARRDVAEVEEILLRAGLVQRAHSTVHWTHGLFREVALELAREMGALEALHRRAASVPSVAADLARRGRHLLAGGCYEEALEPLLTAAKRMYIDRGPFALLLLAERERAIEALGLTDDPRAAEGWAWHAWLLATQEHHDAAERVNRRAADLAERVGHLDALGCCLYTEGVIAEARGAVQQAAEAFERSADRYDRAGNDFDRDWSALAHGRMLTFVDLDAGERALRRLAEETRHRVVRAMTLRVLGARLGAVGRAAEAEPMIRESLAHFERSGQMRHVAVATSLLAMITSSRGDHDGALALLDRALVLLRDISGVDERNVETNKALVLCRAGRFEEALALSTVTATACRGLGSPRLELANEATAARCAAERSDWDRCDVHLRRVEELVDAMEVSEPDLVQQLEALVDRAVAAEGIGLAERGRALLASGLRNVSAGCTHC